MAELFPHLYETHNGTAKPLKKLGKHLDYPARFSYGEWTTVARIPRDEDAYDVEVLELRMPAQFYKVRATGKPGAPSWELSTGSGDAMGELAATIALQTARGMLSVKALE